MKRGFSYALIAFPFLCMVLLSCDDGRVGPLSPKFTATYRDSVLGIGKVLILYNPTVNYYRDVSIKITAPDGTSTTKPVAEVIKPDETIEIGWFELDDWKIDPGEKIWAWRFLDTV